LADGEHLYQISLVKKYFSFWKECFSFRGFFILTILKTALTKSISLKKYISGIEEKYTLIIKCF
jgi:hypothetical protein